MGAGLTMAVALALAFVGAPTAPHAVSQAWASSGGDYAETDSLAACRLSDGTVRVYATAKKGDRIDIIDASTGRRLGTWGRTGTGVGELRYPNGIAAVRFGDDRAGGESRVAIAVVERDNKRVQLFWPETGSPAAILGTDQLHRPYGVAGAVLDRKTVLFVTDTGVARDRTVHVFELSLAGGAITAKHIRHFGEKEGPGAIGEAESILVDERHRRVLLCDESEKNVKVYDCDGRFAGRTFGQTLIVGDPEGLALVEARDARYVILTDQREAVTIWHVFDADGYKHIGSWTGNPTVANTDGVAIYPHQYSGFPHGAFFAVNNDADVRAYRIEDILKTISAAPAEH